jgi:hypothetical protein
MKRLIAVLIAALFLFSIVLAQTGGDKGTIKHKSHVVKTHKTTTHHHLTTHRKHVKVTTHKGKGTNKRVLKLKGKHKVTRGTAKPTAKPLAK